VAEPGDEGTPKFDEEAAQLRRDHGSAVASLNAFSAGADTKLRRKLSNPDPDDAIRTLASEVQQDNLRIPRLQVLDALVRLAHRRGRQFAAHDAALDTLLEALVTRAPGAAQAGEEALSTVRAALESVASLDRDVSDAQRWAVFVQAAGPALGLSRAEVEKPTCNDLTRIKKNGLEAVGVTVGFYTDASPGDLRRFCDPQCWHECSAFQKPMTLWKGAGAINQPGPAPHGWRRALLETVQLAPGMDLVTPLRFTYGIQSENDPNWVHLDYLLVEETNDIAIDEGALNVQRVKSGKHQGRTRVTAIKAVRFKDPSLRAWTTVACDTFWMDLVIQASVGCLGPGPRIDSERKAEMADSKGAPLDKAIDDAAAAAKRSIDAYTQLARKGAAQLAGDSPAAPDRWIDLTAKAWAQAARDAAQAWKIYNDVLEGLAGQDEPQAKKPKPGPKKTDS
jgi:hypothetical protein